MDPYCRTLNCGSPNPGVQVSGVDAKLQALRTTREKRAGKNIYLLIGACIITAVAFQKMDPDERE